MSDRRDPTARPEGPASELARMPRLIERLQREHRAWDDDGRYCTSCTTGGTGTHSTPWPCDVRRLADWADEIRRRGGSTA